MRNRKAIGFFYAEPGETESAKLAVLAGVAADGQLVPHRGLVEDWERVREVLDAGRRPARAARPCSRRG